MPPNNKMDSVLRNYFLGKGFAKPRLIFSAGIRIWFPPRRRGLGRNAGRILFWIFGGRATGKIPHKMIKSFYDYLDYYLDSSMDNCNGFV